MSEAVIAIVVVGVLLLGGGAFFCVKRKKHQGESSNNGYHASRDGPAVPRKSHTGRQRDNSDNIFPNLVPHRLDESEVLLTRKVSTGAFGAVWLGHYRGQPVAVKRMVEGEEESEAFAHEISTMVRLSHPKIVRFVGCTWTSSKDLSAVTEFMDGGDVRSLLENRRVDLSWQKEKISIAIDIAEGLTYLHTLHPPVIHRDLKSSNVMLNKEMVAKLSDFGLSRNLTFEQTQTAGVGTVRWTAPEVMLGESYSERADIYSFGVVLSELDTREIPFEERSSKNGSGTPDMAIVMKVVRGELRPSFKPECPSVILEIAHACIQFDPALRPSAAEVHQRLIAAKNQMLA